tara:strand:- start:1 stop:195 length:195 start_codon:yes stop_codon:yes gene_type:complete
MAFTVLLALRCPEIKGTLAAQRRGYFAPQKKPSARVISNGLLKQRTIKEGMNWGPGKFTPALTA